jgi:hypothetical protein
MRYTTLIFIAVIFVFSTCMKDKQSRKTACTHSDSFESLDNYKIGSLCSSDICSEYLTIWKDLIKEKNNLSQDYFDTHIEVCASELNTWADGISFRVCYKFKIDWAIAYNCDQFIIKISADNKYYPSLDLPRDTYLTKEKVKIAVDNRAFSSDIIKIANIGSIKYSTLDKALNNLIEFSGVNKLCLNQITINEENGDLILNASAQYENEENSCIEGTIDLITGDKVVHDTPCWIN